MNVIAFGLWGDNPKYCVGAIENAKLAKILYKDWICKFYVGNTTPQECVLNLSKMDNVEIINMEGPCDWTSTFWRFYAADSDDTVISRDTDSRLSERERVAVSEWINSNYDFHIMRDHPSHGIEIMAGMWGSRNGLLKGIGKKIENYNKINYYQIEQDFLKQEIYYNIIDKAFVHDSFYNHEPQKKLFPTERIDYGFVGEVYDENNIRHPEHFQIIKKYEQYR